MGITTVINSYVGKMEIHDKTGEEYVHHTNEPQSRVVSDSREIRRSSLCLAP